MKHPKHYDTDEQTSRRMSKVKLKGGKAETILAKKLWHRGFRYHLNDRSLPGSPDIAILKYHIAVFIDGEFWHGYDWENKKKTLKRNREYWVEKIEENINRDREVDLKLRYREWIPIHFWTKEVIKDPDSCVKEIIDEISMVDALIRYDDSIVGKPQRTIYKSLGNAGCWRM